VSLSNAATAPPAPINRSTAEASIGGTQRRENLPVPPS
jgi:hypothetical protein